MIALCVVSILLLVCFQSVSCGYYKENYASFLNQSMYAWYDKRVRPVTDQSHILNVTLSLSLVGVNNLDAVSGTLELVGILKVTWTNQVLVFTSNSDWSGIDAFFLPQENLWRPSLVLYNSVQSLEEVGDASNRIRIDSTGKHEWTVGLVTATSCSVDVTSFPFDSQSCDITFTPWGFKSTEVILTSTDSSADMTFYSESTEWKYESSSVSSSTSSSKSLLTYTVSLKRNPGYYFVNLVMPVIVVALLNLFVFLLPPECGERVGYAVTIFLTFAVYLDIVTNTLPQSSEKVAKVSNYLTSMVILGAITTFLTIMSLWIYHRDEENPIHHRIASMTNFLTCNCGKSKPQTNTVKPSEDNKPAKKALSPSNISVGMDSRQNSMDLEMDRMETIKNPLPSNDSTGMLIQPEDDDAEPEDEMDWHKVAKGFDHLSFFVVLWITLGLSGYYLVPIATGN